MGLTAGDYDGDGVDELAVYVADIGSPRIVVYKLSRNSGNSGSAWKTGTNWKPAWVINLPVSYVKYTNPAGIHIINNACPSNVSLVSDDVDNDGVDDLLYAYSFLGFTSNSSYGTNTNYLVYINSQNHRAENKAGILLGNTSGRMLQNELDFPLPKDVTRLGISTGDANNDGSTDILLAGSVARDNGIIRDEKFLGIYVYDGEGAVACLSSTTYDAIKGMTVDEEWASQNGYDDKYGEYSLGTPAVAVAHLDGPGTVPYVFFDEILFKFESDWQVMTQLDDSSDPNGLGAPFANNESSPYYCSLKVRAVDLTGTGYESFILLSGFSPVTGSPPYLTAIINQFSKSSLSVVYMKNGALTSKGLHTGSSSFLGFALPDCDEDTITLEYTGEHYIEYSNPEVLAVLASAPYFKDVADIDEDGNYLNNSSTEFGKVNGSGEGESTEFSLSAGAFVSVEVSMPASGQQFMQSEAGLTYDYTSSFEKMKTVEQTVTFGTGAGEDTIAFYSVPTEVYIYKATTPDIDESTGEIRGLVESEVRLNFPHKAATVTMPLSRYEEIAENYAELTPIDGKAITHTIGDPSTYPSSSSGYNVIEEFNGDWAGLDYGNGYISQSIDISEESSNTTSNGFTTGLSIGGGFSCVIGASVEGGHSWGTTTVDLTGTSFVGAVGNMPEDARDYGYYYAWKLFSYMYDNPNGNDFPVVSYLVTDVTCPPKLPTDFAQDYSKTTSSDIGLTWTYNGAARNFNIYRYYDFPEGGGSYLVGSVGSDDFVYKRDNKGNIQRDSAGNPIKQFTFIDKGLNGYSEYDYQIQVVSNTAPPESILSPVLTARTKSDVGNPSLSLTDTSLLIYPDTGASVSVIIGNIEDYTQGPKYQWQREIDGVWTDMPAKTAKTLTFKNADYSVNGNYRCRVNVVYEDFYITSYTDTVLAEYSMRKPVVSDVSETVLKSGDMEYSVSVTNPYTGSSAVPSGKVSFQFVCNGAEYVTEVELDNSGKARVESGALKDGLYSITATYLGNRIFSSAKSNVKLSLIGRVTSGYYVDVPQTVYCQDTSVAISIYKVTKNADGTTSTKWINTPGNYDYYLSSCKPDNMPETIDNFGAKVSCSSIIDADSPYLVFDPGERYLCVFNRDASPVTENCIAISKLNLIPCEINIEFSNAYVTAFTDEFENLNVSDYAEIISASVDGYKVEDFISKGGRTYIEYRDNLGRAITPSSSTNPGKYSINVAQSKTAIIGPDISRRFKLSYNNANVYVQANSVNVTANVSPLNGTVPGTVEMISPQRLPGGADFKCAAGTALKFKATPYSGYSIKEWYVNGIAQASSSSVFTYTTLSEDANVKVEFTYNLGVLSYSAISNGTVACANLESGTRVFNGSTWTFTAQPDPGYHFKEWRVVYVGKGVAYPAGTVNDDGLHTCSVTVGQNDVSVYAAFERDNYTVNYTAGMTAYYIGDHDNNLSTPDEKITLPSGAYVKGDTEVVFEAAPGYSIAQGAKWSVSVSGGKLYNRQCTVMITADTFVSVETTRGMFTIEGIYISSPLGPQKAGDGVVVKVDNEIRTESKLSVPGGSTVSIELKPSTDRWLDYWIIDGEPIYSRDLVFTMSENITQITAMVVYYQKLTFNVDAAQADMLDVTYSINSGEEKKLSDLTASGGYYSIKPLSDADSITFTANDKVNNAAGYSLKNWTLNGSTYLPQKSITFTNLNKLCVSNLTATIGLETNPLKVYSLTFDNGNTNLTANFEDDPYKIHGSTVKPVFSTFTSPPENQAITFYLNGEKIENIRAYTNTFKIFNKTYVQYFYEVTEPIAVTGNLSFAATAATEIAPDVTGISVSISELHMVAGEKRHLIAEVQGTNLTESSKLVEWSISGNNNGTSLDQNGNLVIGPNEYEGKVITITVRSKYNTSVRAGIKVLIVEITTPTAADPVIASFTYDSITVTTVPKQEYAIVSGSKYGNYNSGAFKEEWLQGTDEVVFTNLVAETKYTIVSRIIGAGTAANMSNPVPQATAKKPPENIIFPTAESLVYGQTLSQSKLSGGVGDGTFKWENGDTVPTVNNEGYLVRFIPSKTNLSDYTGYSLTAFVEITVAKATAPIVIFPSSTMITYGQPLSASLLRGGSGDGTFAWEDSTTVPEVFNDGCKVIFTPNDTDNYDYTGVNFEGIVNITVKKAAPEPVMFPTAANIIYGNSLADSVLSGGSGDGTFEWKYPTDEPDIGTSKHEVVFVPADEDNYNYSSVRREVYVYVTVDKAPAGEITFPSASAITYGQTLEDSALSGGVGDGTFAWADSSIAPVAGSLSFDVTFTPADTLRYDYSATALTRKVSAEVAKAQAEPVVFPTAEPVVYPATLSMSALTGGSGDGTFAWADGSVTPAIGTNSYEVVFTPRDADNYDYSAVTLTQSVSVDVDKMAANEVPAAPVLVSATQTTLTFEQVDGAEYSIDGGSTWQPSAVFNSLTAETEYSVIARAAGSGTQYASAASEATVVSTLRNPIKSSAASNGVDGLLPLYYRTANVSVTAVGAGMDNNSPISGDTRFVPVSWQAGENGGNFNGSYNISYKASTGKSLTVTYREEVYNGSSWEATGNTDEKTFSVTVETFMQMLMRFMKNFIYFIFVEPFRYIFKR